MAGRYSPSPSPQSVQFSFTAPGAGNTLTCRGRFYATLSGDGIGTYGLECKLLGGDWAAISKNLDGDPFVVTKGATDSFAFPLDEFERDTLYRWNALTHSSGTTVAGLRIGGSAPANPFHRASIGPAVGSHVFPSVFTKLAFEPESGSASVPPVNTVAPAVTGTAVVGQLLSCSDGTWTGTAPITFAYQWKRNGSDIGGATGNTYTLVQADAGNASNIKCAVTATNAAGVVSADSNTVATIWDASADAWFTAVSWAVGDDTTQRQAFNALYISLKSGGFYTRLDEISVRANRDLAAALRGLKLNLTGLAVNSPTFTQWRGIKGNATTSYVNSTFVPSTGGVNYALNSASVIAYCRNAGSVRNFDMSANNAGNVSTLIFRFSDGSAYGCINTGATSYATTAVANGVGLYVISRTAASGAGAQTLYKDGSSIATGTQASTGLPAVSFYEGGRNASGSPDQLTDAEISLVAYGDGFNSSDVTAFKAIIDTFRTAIGF